MIHKPIRIHNLSLNFPHKNCFDDFSCQIHYGQRIAIIGRNGSGKSTLVKIIKGDHEPTEGFVVLPEDAVVGYVPQIVQEFENVSGAERFHEALTRALSMGPNCLILDEPTNHLDRRNRDNLMSMLQSYTGTLIVVSHDTELVRHCAEILWHIESGRIHTFHGSYDHYMSNHRACQVSLEQELSVLKREQKEAHESLMKEQKRAKNSRARGEKHVDQRKWPTIVSKAKAQKALETSGKNRRAIADQKETLFKKRASLYVPEVILPKFALSPRGTGSQSVISIYQGSVGYQKDHWILTNVSLSLSAHERLSILGDNGSGKSTLIKGILSDSHIVRSGEWCVPKPEDIGYLDQHYRNLDPQKTVLETIEDIRPCGWGDEKIRQHLNGFLFRKNEEVNASTATLSGGEKTRLSLACIAACFPKLLVLDEVTNNIDLETKEHIIQVLKFYPGAMIVVSHDNDFLNSINITKEYKIMPFSKPQK